MRSGNEEFLIEEFKLSRSDFYSIKRMGNIITVLRRPGVEKLIKETNMVIDDFSIQVNAVPGFIIATATITAHIAGDKLNSTITCASASNENCIGINSRYPETAEKRAKHRALFQLLGLSQRGVESIDASADFELSDPDNKEEKKKVVKKAEEKGTPDQQVEDMMASIKKKRSGKK